MEFYATLGAACQKRETLEQMFRAGMTGIRLNLSHTSLGQCRPLLESRFFPAARAAGVAPQLMIDLQGPELRVGQLPYPIDLREGKDVLLDIEVQGAAKVRARCPEAIFIFIIPPSFEELSRRLHNRNTDNEDVIAGRLEKAKIEFREIPTYDYLVINDKVSNAVEEIEAILVANECRVDNRRNILKGEFSL